MDSLFSYALHCLRFDLEQRLKIDRTPLLRSQIGNLIYRILLYNSESCLLTLFFNKSLPYTGNISSFVFYNQLDWLLKALLDRVRIPNFTIQIGGVRHDFVDPRFVSNENIEEEFDTPPAPPAPRAVVYTQKVVLTVFWSMVYTVGFARFVLWRRFDASMAKYFV